MNMLMLSFATGMMIPSQWKKSVDHSTGSSVKDWPSTGEQVNGLKIKLLKLTTFAESMDSLNLLSNNLNITSFKDITWKLNTENSLKLVNSVQLSGHPWLVEF